MKLIVFSIVAAMGLTTAATAQVNPNVMRSSPPLDTMRVNGIDRMNQIQSEAQRRRMTEQAAQSPERQERAQRLSAMVNNGQCLTAYNTAVEEGDRDMAQRIRAVCTEVTASPPVTEPTPGG